MLSCGQPLQPQQTPDSTQVILIEKSKLWSNPMAVAQKAFLYVHDTRWWLQKWSALGNGITAWMYPGVNQLGKNSLTAVTVKWDISLHIPSYCLPPPLPYICTVEDNWTQCWKLRNIVRNVVLGTAYACAEGWEGNVCQRGVVKGTLTTFILRPDLGSAQELGWVSVSCFPKLKAGRAKRGKETCLWC